MALAVFSVAASVGPASAGAQTLPLPVVPLPSPPSASTPGAPSPSTADITPPTRSSEYALGLAAGYDTNISFLPNGSRDVVLAPRADFTRLFRGPRGQLSLRALGHGFVYAQETSLSRVDADAGFDGTHALSTHTTIGAQLDAGLGHTDSSRVLDDQGVRLPLTRTRYLLGAANLDWRVGDRTSVRADVRGYRTDFEDPLLLDSGSVRGALTFSGRLSERNSLSGQYSLERAKSDSIFVTHFGSLQWSRLLSPRSAILLEGGASYTDQAAASGLANTWNFFGGASFNRQVVRSSVVLFARREVVPAFGEGGLRLSDRFGVQATVPLGHAVEFELSGTYVRRTVPEGYTGDRGTGEDVSFALRRILGRRLVMAAEARYRRRGPEGLVPAIEEFQGGLSFSFTSPRAASNS